MAHSNLKPGVRILQWNANDIKNKINELNFHLDSTDVALISETWLSGKDVLFFKGFDVIRRDRPNGIRGGGVAILIQKKYKYKIKNLNYTCNSKLGVSAIDLLTNREFLTIASCYRPPHGFVSVNEWKTFLKQFNDCPLLIGGDFNAHCTSWGDKKNCNTGSNLENALFEIDFFVVNSGTVTYINFANNTESVLDLMVISSDLGLSFNWHVGFDSWGSDHFPIFSSINEEILTIPATRRVHRLHNKKMDWNKFKQEVSSKIALFDQWILKSRIHTLLGL